MARINRVKKARKAQGPCGKCKVLIQPGDPYRWTKNRYGPKRVRCMSPGCSFRPSELVSSDKLARIYEAQEMIEDLSLYWIDPDDLEGMLEDIKGLVEQAYEQAREVGEEYNESLENMPEGLQQGDVGQEIEEKAQACEEYAQELESIVDASDTPEDEDGLHEIIAQLQQVELAI